MELTGKWRNIRRGTGIALALICVCTFPWSLVYAAPVILAYAVTRRRSWCSQAAVLAGCISLLFMVYWLIRYTLWKNAGNYDAQEGLTLLFIGIWQYLISAVSMTITWLFCAGYRNVSTYHEKKN